MDLCGHGLRLDDSSPLVKEAYRVFVHNPKAAIDFLRKFRMPRNQTARFIRDFRERYGDFTGQSSNIPTSELEQKVEQQLIDSGIFFKRQVPYKEITRTNRNYVMDFLVGNTVIEVCDDNGDEFIHDHNYWQGLQEKNMLAEQAGYSFLVIDDATYTFCDLTELISGNKDPPQELYEIKDTPQPSYQQDPPTPRSKDPFYTSRQIFFGTYHHEQQPWIGMMRKVS